MIKEFNNKEYGFSGRYDEETAKKLGVKLVEYFILNGLVLEPESIVQSDFFNVDFIPDFVDIVEEVLEIEYNFYDE